METPKEYYYTYYSYEEYGRGYFGSRGCKCLPEEDVRYFGTFKDKTFRPTEKIILKDDYNTREEAIADEIILHDYYDVANNPHFANRAKATSTGFYVSKEVAIESGRKTGKKYGHIGGKINGKKCKELGIGIFALTLEQKIEINRKTYELGVGIFALTPEQRTKNCIKGGQKTKELGRGIFARTPEQMTEDRKKAAKITNSQRWKCLETGFITNAGLLSRYQKARGIDTSLRERVR
jgi:hypothetical protein